MADHRIQRCIGMQRGALEQRPLMRLDSETIEQLLRNARLADAAFTDEHHGGPAPSRSRMPALQQQRDLRLPGDQACARAAADRREAAVHGTFTADTPSDRGRWDSLEME